MGGIAHEGSIGSHGCFIQVWGKTAFGTSFEGEQ
jgi:hypothetical protein